jgi:hypothetical protein
MKCDRKLDGLIVVIEVLQGIVVLRTRQSLFLSERKALGVNVERREGVILVEQIRRQ